MGIAAYVSRDEPPAGLVSSVRAIVFRGDQVLVMRNRDGTHIFPGGRVECGESQVEALRREVIEEAGIEIADIRRIGFMHLRHKKAKPPDYPYPYPDFFWSIFSAHYLRDISDVRVPDEYELSEEFLPVANLRCMEISQPELAFLQEITGGDDEKDTQTED